MAKEWTDAEVQAEISAAVAIVREDRFEKFLRGKIGGTANDDDKKTPPKTEDTSGKPPVVKKSLWWGDQSSD